MTRTDTGGPQVLAKVFRDYEPSLRRFLRARLVPHADQEDIIQDVFLRLASTDNVIEKLSATTGSTQSYLFSIATRLLIDRSRRAASRQHGRHDSYEEEMVEADQIPPDMAASMREELDAIFARLNKLKPKCRRAFILSRFEHKSYPEIAREMNLSVGSVERYITIALAALRKRGKL